MRIANVSSKERYVLLALDRVFFYKELLGIQLDTPEGKSILKKFITLATDKLTVDATGLIIESDFGFEALKLKSTLTGVLFSLEKTENLAPLQLPLLNGQWGVESCRENYGMAKLEFYYHPQEEQALAKKKLIAEIHDYCRYVGIDLLVIVRMHHPQGGVLAASVLVDAQLQTIHELQKNCEIIGLEYPGSALASATITAELDIPWLLVSQSQVKIEPYQEFKLHLRESLENGAHGAILGEVLFEGVNNYLQEDASLDWAQLQQFIQTQARDRIVESSRIVNETIVGST